jgi:hypothetical protein
MDSVRHYQGLGFEVWDGQQTWFWLVLNPNRDGGAIGAAATENAAVRDACRSIDEMLSMRAQPRRSVDWEISLSNLEHYLAQCCEQSTVR